MLLGTHQPPTDGGQVETSLLDKLVQPQTCLHLPLKHLVLVTRKDRTPRWSLAPICYGKSCGPKIPQSKITDTEESHIGFHHPQAASWMMSTRTCPYTEKSCMWPLSITTKDHLVSPPMALAFRPIPSYFIYKYTLPVAVLKLYSTAAARK